MDFLDQVEQIADQDRIKQRVEDCGKYYRVIVHLTRTAVPILCGNRNKCDNCMNVFVKKEEERLRRALENGRVKFKVVEDEKELELISRKALKQVRKYPQSDGKIVVLYEETGGNKDDNGKVIRSVEEVDFKKIARTPEGKRVTGKLGSVIKKKEDKTLEIPAALFTIHATAKEIQDGNEKVESLVGDNSGYCNDSAEAQYKVDKVVQAYKTVFGSKVAKVTFTKVKVSRYLLERDIKINTLETALRDFDIGKEEFG